MKLFVLAAVPLLVASSTLARSPLRRGQSTDTCAMLNADLVFPDVEKDGKPYDAGHIDVGLCVSQVKTFVGHYDVTEAAAKVVGVDRVERAVTDLIDKTGMACAYPPHAAPSVTRDDACSFVCMDGFLAMPVHRPTACVCPPQMKTCDGRCGHFNSDCSQTAPPSRRAQPTCAEGLTMCGVPDAASDEAYKCVDPSSDAYTCGGCVKASPFGGSTGGVDCREIANVDEVSCAGSKCVVRTCKSGFVASASKDKCVATHHARSLRAPNAGHIAGVAGVPAQLVKGQMDMVGRGSVVDAHGTDAASNAVHHALSAGKVGTKGPRGCDVTDSQC